jgi:putative flippase GtrA
VRDRLVPFVAIGAAGFATQLASLHLLVSYTGVHYLLATALAVEAAILLNFLCHSQWTWRDRVRAGADARTHLSRLARFNALSALSSVAGNVAFTAVLVYTLDVPVVAANAIAVALVSTINFTGLDRWVFATAPVPRSTRVPTAAVLVTLSLSLPLGASAAELTAETRRAWQRHVAATEARIDRELQTPDRFLSMDFDAAADRRHARDLLRDGAVLVTNLQDKNGTVDVPGGAIHHWRGLVFVPNVTVEEVLRTVSDPAGARAHRQEDVLEARVLSRSPGSLRLFLRLQRRVIVSAAYNTEHDVAYRAHGSGRASSRSIATKIAEVVRPGEPGEYECPPGVDRGFLWGLNSYWRYQAVPGGVLVELESLTLSRSVPWGAGAVVRPLVDQVARESISRTLQALRLRFAEGAAA